MKREPPKRPAVSSTALSMKYLRKLGYLPAKVEQWVPVQPGTFEDAPERDGFRLDLFHFIDIVAIKKGETLAVQATTYRQIADHKLKIQTAIEFEWVKLAGWKIHLHGWKDGGLVVIDMTNELTLFSEILKQPPRKKGRLRKQIPLFA